jgi:hypothetical protein
MKKILLLSIATVTIYAQNLRYKITAPLFGEVGRLDISYFSGSSYNINASMKTFGFAKKLSGNRVEHYSASGSVKGNKYYAKSFTQDAKYKNKKTHLEYNFDYKNKKILKTRYKWKNSKQTTNYTKPLKYFTYNDLFSSYHNIVAQLKGKPAGQYRMLVAGMEKYGGYLLIKIPSKSVQAKEAKSMGAKGSWVFHIVTRKSILKSKNGEIVFAVGSDGIAKAVRVLDIPFVSHLDAKLVR